MIKGIHPCKIGIEHFPALHITAGLGGGGFTGGAATIIGAAAGTPLLPPCAYRQAASLHALPASRGEVLLSPCRSNPANDTRRQRQWPLRNGQSAAVCPSASPAQSPAVPAGRETPAPTETAAAGSALKIFIQHNRRTKSKIYPHLVQSPGA